MALTDNCDVFFAAHENGINRVIGQATTQRPSLVNYGSQQVAADPGLLCAAVQANPVVLQRKNPLVTKISALPVAGSASTVDYGVQLTLPQVDFSPGTITLPAELNPPLPAQHFAARTTVCAGIACPSEEQLTCFCVDLFAIGGVGFTSPGPAGQQNLFGRLDGLDIVDITPAELESAINCYAGLVIRLVGLPLLSRLAFPYPSPPLNLGFAAATVKPSTSAAIPNNPALEDDQIKAFLDLILTKGSSGGSSPKPPGVPRPRVRTGPFDITIALSKAAFRNIIDDFRDGFTLGSTSGGGNFGPFSLTYTATAMSLADGTVDLHNDNTVSISGLDINFGTLSVCIGIDIPQICVGGFCLVPPVGSPPLPCFVRAPTICIFGGNPTIQSCLDVGPLITAEISATLTPLTKYSVNPARTPSMNDWDADDANVQNHWQVYVDPLTIHLDLFDIADNALDLFINAVNTAIDALLAPLPGWAQDLIKSILGPVIDLVRTILGFGADFGQWLADQLAGLGIIDIILTAIADYLAKDNPLIQVADPINIVAKDPSIPLIQILIPVEFAGVHVTADELIVEADIADPT